MRWSEGRVADGDERAVRFGGSDEQIATAAAVLVDVRQQLRDGQYGVVTYGRAPPSVQPFRQVTADTAQLCGFHGQAESQFPFDPGHARHGTSWAAAGWAARWTTASHRFGAPRYGAMLPVKLWMGM
ncbi:hypothetical protein DVH02_30685 [Streptomyces corynorhini]|uniref:Uncharacterized protein n=1 Tax=Streptomyces corynorhini TaxID=2282652 RepID=A0A370AX76_9ACTN|nr:hypothetical protein DVH02_30685 [Streptomyces corynorhini]